MIVWFSERRGFLQILSEVVRRAFDFRGRSKRTDGFIWYVMTVLLSEVVAGGSVDGFNESVAWQTASIAFVFIFALPLAGWSVRRLHDCNQAGWWALILVIPVMPIWSERLAGSLQLLAFIPWAMLLFWPPTSGENRFGPNPRTAVAPEP
jgi:uncharacterized membrane protein YhaH (DUF805 family)